MSHLNYTLVSAKTLAPRRSCMPTMRFCASASLDYSVADRL